MSLRKVVAISLVSFLAVGGVSHAGSIALTLNVTNDYNVSNGSALHSGAAAIADSQNGVNAYYKVGIYASMVGAATGEVYGNQSWNMVLGTGLSKPGANLGTVKEGYVASNPIPSYSGNPDGTGVYNNSGVQYTTTFGTNTDTGSDDFQNILATMDGLTLGDTFDVDGAAIQPDPRTQFVTTSPTLIGSVFVLWNGTQTTPLSTSGYQFSTATPSGNWADGNTKYTFGTVAVGNNPTYTFTSVPEPASLALLGLGGLGLAAYARRRRS